MDFGLIYIIMTDPSCVFITSFIDDESYEWCVFVAFNLRVYTTYPSM